MKTARTDFIQELLQWGKRSLCIEPGSILNSAWARGLQPTSRMRGQRWTLAKSTHWGSAGILANLIYRDPCNQTSPGGRAGWRMSNQSDIQGDQVSGVTTYRGRVSLQRRREHLFLCPSWVLWRGPHTQDGPRTDQQEKGTHKFIRVTLVHRCIHDVAHMQGGTH